MPGALHISNGDATDVPGTGLARRVIYWRDILHEGPVPEVPPAELRRIRAGYLTGYQGAGRAGIMRQFTERDQALEAGRDGEYVLWFEADLYDQLQIAEILARLAVLGEQDNECLWPVQRAAGTSLIRLRQRQQDASSGWCPITMSPPGSAGPG